MSSAIAATEPITTAWRTVRLADVCQCKPPKSIPRKVLDDESTVSFVPMRDLGELTKHFEAKSTRKFGEVVKGYTYFADGDVLCAKITPCFENGKLGIAQNLDNGVGFGSSEFVVMRSKGEILPEYLYYYLSRDAFREAGKAVMSGAVGHKRVPKEYFENLEIPLAPLDEQKRIVAVLDQVFAAINRARVHVETNLASTKILLQGILEKLFATKDENWSLQTLNSLANVIADGNWIEKKDQSESGIRLLQTGNVGEGVYKDRRENARYINQETFDRLRCFEIFPQDILISRLPDPVGRACIVPEKEERMITAVDCAILRLDKSQIYSKFFIYYSLTNSYLNSIRQMCTGTTRSRISRKNLGKIKIPIPPLAKQKEIINFLDHATEEIEQYRLAGNTKLSNFDELRRSFLREAFNGKLT